MVNQYGNFLLGLMHESQEQISNKGSKSMWLAMLEANLSSAVSLRKCFFIFFNSGTKAEN